MDTLKFEAIDIMSLEESWMDELLREISAFDENEWPGWDKVKLKLIERIIKHEGDRSTQEHIGIDGVRSNAMYAYMNINRQANKPRANYINNFRQIIPYFSSALQKKISTANKDGNDVNSPEKLTIPSEIKTELGRITLEIKKRLSQLYPKIGTNIIKGTVSAETFNLITQSKMINLGNISANTKKQ